MIPVPLSSVASRYLNADLTPEHGLAVCNRHLSSVCTLHPTAVVRCVKCNTRCFRDNKLADLAQ